MDGRADLYALGCVAFWLLTGRLVFETDSAVAMLAAHLERRPRAPSASAPGTVPPILDEVVLQCLAKSPDDRPRSAEELASRLAEVSLETPWLAEDAERWWSSRTGQGSLTSS